MIIIKIIQKITLKKIKDQKQNRIKELKGKRKEPERKLIKIIQKIIMGSYKPMDLTFLQNLS